MATTKREHDWVRYIMAACLVILTGVFVTDSCDDRDDRADTGVLHD